MNTMVLIGIGVLFLTAWDFFRDETDTLLIFDRWPWFDISRQSSPLTFWVIIIIQIGIGLSLIFKGLSGS